MGGTMSSGHVWLVSTSIQIATRTAQAPNAKIWSIDFYRKYWDTDDKVSHCRAFSSADFMSVKVCIRLNLLSLSLFQEGNIIRKFVSDLYFHLNANWIPVGNGQLWQYTTT